MKQITFLVIFLSCAFCAYSQYTVNGFVYDKTSATPLAGATIYFQGIDSGSAIGTSSEDKGAFSLTLAKGTYQLTCSRVGYGTYTDTLTISQSRRLTINLSEQIHNLQEVTITERADGLRVNDPLNAITIPQRVLQKMPRFTGEADVMKTLQFLPGVSQGSEGSSGLYVRGGDPGQNLTLVDGVPVYNFYHLFGFFSTINSEAVNQMQLYKGGISGQYEGRLSSVVDVALKEGSKQDQKGRFSLSPIAGTFYLEGPIKKDKASFIFTGRRTWLDALAALANMQGDNKAGFNFHDVSGKIHYELTDKQALNVSVYHSRDKLFNRYRSLDLTSDFSFKWHNTLLNASHDWDISPTFQMNSAVSGSDFIFQRKEVSESYGETDFRKINTAIRDLTVKSKARWLLGAHHTLTTGTELTRRVFDPGVSMSFSNQLQVVNNYEEQTHMVSIFAEDFMQWKRFELLASVRQTFYTPETGAFANLQPHALVRYRFSDEFALKATVDHTTQYLHLLTSTQLGQPTDIWVPATQQAPPSRSRQYTVGTEYDKPSFSWSVEAYWKAMEGLIEFRDGANFIYGDQANWEDKVFTGEGASQGVEVLISKNKGRLTGWLAYTLSRTDRLFEELNNGRAFPFKYDRTHVADVVVLYDLNEQSSISATFSYRTGSTLTLPMATYQSDNLPYWPWNGGISGTTQTLIEERNNYRMPSYHRLDISYEHTKQLKKNRARTWAVSVYNVYNQLNLFFIYEQAGEFRQFALFPIIPSVSYTYSFGQ
jgi:outer membrane cobalamin receptor